MIHFLPGFDPTPFEAVRDAVDWQQKSVTVYGKEHAQPRLTRWYGLVPYTYSNLRWEADPMPSLLVELAAKVGSECSVKFNSVMCNLYRDGKDSVGWHADDEPIFGDAPVVASLSYGGTRKFQLRHNKTREVLNFFLGQGDLLVMGSEVQTSWQHSIPRTSKSVGPRINLTFRKTV